MKDKQEFELKVKFDNIRMKEYLTPIGIKRKRAILHKTYDHCLESRFKKGKQCQLKDLCQNVLEILM